MRIEPTAVKIKKSEWTRYANNRLATNRVDLGFSIKTIKEGKDDR